MSRVPPDNKPSDWRENRRFQAWDLDQQGWTQRQIAEELGVTQGAISQWLKRSRENGVDGLRRHPAPGRQAALTEEQLQRIPVLLAEGPEVFGFPGGKWTCARVAAMLKQVFGVSSYHPAHVCRLLNKHFPGWRDTPNG